MKIYCFNNQRNGTSNIIDELCLQRIYINQSWMSLNLICICNLVSNYSHQWVGRVALNLFKFVVFNTVSGNFKDLFNMLVCYYSYLLYLIYRDWKKIEKFTFFFWSHKLSFLIIFYTAFSLHRRNNIFLR